MIARQFSEIVQASRAVTDEDALDLLTTLRLSMAFRDYGRWPATNAELFKMSEIWARLLNRRGVDARDLPEAADRLCLDGGEFPTPARLADAADAVLRDRTVTVGVVMPDGTVGQRRMSRAEYEAQIGLEPELSDEEWQAIKEKIRALREKFGVQHEASRLDDEEPKRAAVEALKRGVGA